MYGVELDGHVDVAPGHADAIEDLLDLVMEHLLELEVIDAALTADLSDRSIMVSMAVEASDPAAAVVAAGDLLCAAVRSAGGAPHSDHEAADEPWRVTLRATRASLLRDDGEVVLATA